MGGGLPYRWTGELDRRWGAVLLDADGWLLGSGGGSLKGQEHLVKHHDLLAVLVKDRRVFLLKTAHLSI